MPPIRKTAGSSPFARASAALWEMGYSPLVIIPGEKRPGRLIWRDGERRWVGDLEWERFCDRKPSEIELAHFCNLPDAGIGVAHGRASGDLGGIDFDDDTFGCHTEILNALDALPGTPVARRGARGQLRYFRAGPGVVSRIYRINKMPALELLAQGRQSVVPPTLHPDTGAPYYWTTPDTLEDTPPEKLPLLTAVFVRDVIEPTLRRVGWEPEAERPKAAEALIAGGGFWSEVNARSLADLGAWVPDLGLERLRSSRGGFEAVPSFRASGRGRPDEERDRSLSIHPCGIRDFGTGEGYSPIDLVAAVFGTSEQAAAEWLEERVMPPPDPIAAMSQAALATAARSEEPEAEGALPDDETAAEPQLAAVPRGGIDTSELDDFRFPASPYSPEALGGLLGDIARYLLDTALFPVPDFAVMAAITFGGALYGRRWSEPLMGGGLNVYVVASAPSGWGKDHPIQEMPKLAYKCDMSRLLGPSEFASDAAIEKTLRDCPVRACFMDEIGIVLQANANRNAGPWEKRIRKVVLQVYSASKGIWSGRQAAGDQIDKGREPIHRPTLSFYGTSTPEELYKGLTEDNIKDGLFGRMIFVAPNRRPEKGKRARSDLAPIRAAVEAVLQFVPPHIEERQRALYRSNAFNAVLEPDVVQVPASSEAIGAIESILGWQRDLVEREDGLSKIANRAGENVGKLATLRALSRDHEGPRVELEDVRWGWSVVERSLAAITRDIERHMSGSEFEALVKAIRRHLEEAGRDGLKFAELIRRRGVSKAHARDVMAALSMLKDAGDVAIEKPKPNSRGFRIRVY